MVGVAPATGNALYKRKHEQCYQACGESVVVKIVSAAGAAYYQNYRRMDKAGYDAVNKSELAGDRRK